jgi:16S rRNA (cytidine1402-2'-O)-methyltransferase
LQARAAVKGEITLLIGKAEEATNGADTDAAVRTPVHVRLQQIMSEDNVDEKSALKKIAKERGISKSEAYRELQRSK